MVTVDYAGPFERVGGHAYTLFLVQNMTWFLDGYTTKEATGDATLKGMGQYCQRYRFLRVVHSDRGSHFHNQECLEWAAQNGDKGCLEGQEQRRHRGEQSVLYEASKEQLSS